MLTWDEDVDAQALHRRGWSISAIARHLGRDRKTIRAYLAGERTPGARRPAGEDAFDAFEAYVAARLAEDPHVWLSTLYDEVAALGYARSYPTFTRAVRDRGLRPACADCAGVAGRPTVDLDHPAGDETQWDWVELPGAPWLDGGPAQLLVGALAFSSQTRGCFADATDQPHLIEALDGVVRRFGGTTRAWRFDRMSTVVAAGTDRILPSFAAVAKHYGVEVRLCPPYRANRKGSVEKPNHFIAQRWWRTADITTRGEAQASLDAFLATVGDARRRRRDGHHTTVGELAAHEGLAALPDQAYPAEVTREAVVARDATVAFDGNRYGVTPSLIGQAVTIRHRLGSPTVEIHTPAGLVAATHPRAASGAGQVVRTTGQRAALEQAVLDAATTQGRPCRRKTHRPPGEAAQAEAARLRQAQHGDPAQAVVIDLGVYQDHVERLHAADDDAPAPDAADAEAVLDGLDAADTDPANAPLTGPCGCFGRPQPTTAQGCDPAAPAGPDHHEEDTP